MKAFFYWDTAPYCKPHVGYMKPENYHPAHLFWVGRLHLVVPLKKPAQGELYCFKCREYFKERFDEHKCNEGECW